ncbi:MAG: FKBP-type peptidyl-prolyl cis-trans isomerase [Alistipes sp.]|jgi:hypothetical protein|nr:FKBP-type peptidyl-prolyl cis-trans isomerase [Alistipes sp.]
MAQHERHGDRRRRTARILRPGVVAALVSRVRGIALVSGGRGVALAAGAVTMFAAAVSTVACGPDEASNQARDRIVNYLNNEGLWERGNVPDDAKTNIGSFDIIGGVYRHIVNETSRDNRFDPSSHTVEEGDVITFMFDARVFGGSPENSTTFYTNIASLRNQIVSNNPDFNAEYWPIDPLEITVGSDPQILKAVQMALVGCQTDNGDLTDDIDGGVKSDQVHIFIPPDIAFGKREFLMVPANSTLLFVVTDIEFIERAATP